MDNKQLSVQEIIVAETGMGVVGAIMVTGLTVGTVLTAGTPIKLKNMLINN